MPRFDHAQPATGLMAELEPTGSLGPGASAQQLAEFQALLGVALPSDYTAFLAWANGWEGFCGESYLRLDGVEGVLAGDDAFRSQFPGMIAIGGDGGLETYALDYRQGECSGLVAVDRNSTDPEDIWFVGPNFSEALQSMKARPDGPWQE
jgi:hypothetical protein